MARDEPLEGENANQPYDEAVERAIKLASAQRVARVDYELDADAHTATLVMQPERLMTDLAAPEPVRVTVLWGHLKILMGAILAHEGELYGQKSKLMTAPHLVREGQQELAAMKALKEAEQRRAGGPGGGHSTGGAGGEQIPGFDV